MGFSTMKKNFLNDYHRVVALLISLMIFTSCALLRKAEVYNMSYDKTYLTALTALDDLSDWHLLETDQIHGTIKIERSGYFHPTQQATVIVKQLGPFQTKLEVIDKHNTLFNRKFFKAVDKRVANDVLTHPS